MTSPIRHTDQASQPRQASLDRHLLSNASNEAVARNTAFRDLVSERTRFGWILTGLMLVVWPAAGLVDTVLS